MTHYTSGRRLEYKVMEILRKEGYEIVLRTAGSHGKFDVIAGKSDPPHSKWIQVKSGDAKYIAREIKKWKDNPPMLAPYNHAELWCWQKFHGNFEIVTTEEK